ncbi:hypothetical protein H2200_001604 [Cladophialophora chaetospira]|uniref:D-xylose 1-dehydrogenase (NADP(+), D-xylono-1,5-lactone-forming) n=1 Tax=Cladophialophora chaetospira TaxID=386627 RepID=A0AA38XL81_9EURO|nr:hypothetical protein H2200_001604 [Cladophialophora chaetospira]
MSWVAEASSPFLRIGVLSAAAINYTAIFDPVSTHPSAVITGIAARSVSRAEAQIAENKRFFPLKCTAYGSYDALLAAEDVDAVYISLPNGLHHKWALAALAKGKHVLIEKPIASNAQQAREIFEAAARAGKIAMEAFHWRLHPAAHVVKQLLLSGEYGRVLSVNPQAMLPAGLFKKDDIRFQYDLAGGCCMDLTYVFSASAYFAARDITDPNLEFEVVQAQARLHPKEKLIDEAISATILIKDPHPYATPARSGPATVTCNVKADLLQPKLFGLIPKLWQGGTPSITIQTERAEIIFSNFMGPWAGHSITVTSVERSPTDSTKIVSRGAKRVLKQYKGGPLWDQELADEGGGEEWFTTYRWQLEAFTRMIEKGESGYKGPWMSSGESIRIMELIDATYEKLGLPVRGL